MYFDESGSYRRTRVCIVYGAPASGKTTYVMEHMEAGDLICDVDKIRAALTFSDEHSDTNSLLPIILGVRDFLYTQIENLDMPCRTAWIIALLPRYMERQRLQHRFNAEMVHISTTKDQCIEHMLKDTSRKDKQQQQILIERYFDSYEEAIEE